jgi:hypothetical protein
VFRIPPLEVSVTPKCLWRASVENKVSSYALGFGKDLVIECSNFVAASAARP